MLIVNARLQIPLSEFRFTYARSSGPGGQNVNKVNTKATLRWRVALSPSLSQEIRDRFLVRYQRRVTAGGELLITSQRFRDAGRNTADCVERLRRMLLEVSAPPKRRKPTRPTRASVRRRLAEKRGRSRIKQHRRLPGED